MRETPEQPTHALVWWPRSTGRHLDAVPLRNLAAAKRQGAVVILSEMALLPWPEIPMTLQMNPRKVLDEGDDRCD